MEMKFFSRIGLIALSTASMLSLAACSEDYTPVNNDPEKPINPQETYFEIPDLAGYEKAKVLNTADAKSKLGEIIKSTADIAKDMQFDKINDLVAEVMMKEKGAFEPIALQFKDTNEKYPMIAENPTMLGVIVAMSMTPGTVPSEYYWEMVDGKPVITKVADSDLFILNWKKNGSQFKYVMKPGTDYYEVTAGDATDGVGAIKVYKQMDITISIDGEEEITNAIKIAEFNMDEAIIKAEATVSVIDTKVVTKISADISPNRVDVGVEFLKDGTLPFVKFNISGKPGFSTQQAKEAAPAPDEDEVVTLLGALQELFGDAATDITTKVQLGGKATLLSHGSMIMPLFFSVSWEDGVMSRDDCKKAAEEMLLCIKNDKSAIYIEGEGSCVPCQPAVLEDADDNDYYIAYLMQYADGAADDDFMNTLFEINPDDFATILEKLGEIGLGGDDSEEE